MYERMRPLHRPNPSPPSPLHQAWHGRTVSVQPPPPELPQFLQMGRRWVEETDQLPPPPLCSLPSLRRKTTSRAEEEERTGTRRGVGVATANLRAPRCSSTSGWPVSDRARRRSGSAPAPAHLRPRPTPPVAIAADPPRASSSLERIHPAPARLRPCLAPTVAAAVDRPRAIPSPAAPASPPPAATDATTRIGRPSRGDPLQAPPSLGLTSPSPAGSSRCAAARRDWGTGGGLGTNRVVV
nr:formin-like protein 14 [Lolium perenne]